MLLARLINWNSNVAEIIHRKGGYVKQLRKWIWFWRRTKSKIQYNSSNLYLKIALLLPAENNITSLEKWNWKQKKWQI